MRSASQRRCFRELKSSAHLIFGDNSLSVAEVEAVYSFRDPASTNGHETYGVRRCNPGLTLHAISDKLS
jgi:hypothetical protein